jgi:3-oxoacyl-[acyl-carrier-protein] synthase III
MAGQADKALILKTSTHSNLSPGIALVSHPALQGRGFLATSLSGACGPWSQLRLANPAINGGACARPVVSML